VLAVLLIFLCVSPAMGLRANLRQDMAKLEEMGRFEEALFYRRSSMDMILAVHVAWSGAAYDGEMDKFVFAPRVDRRYWNMVHDQKRPITELLAKGKLSSEQLQRLEERVRVYVEDHLSPEFDEMGNFYFRRGAWCLERAGMFFDASGRRRLTGYYCQRVCVPYYSIMAQELEEQGSATLAAAYRAKAEWFAGEALREFRRSNGDRMLAQLQVGDVRQPRQLAEVLEALKKGMGSKDADVRLAAAMNLADLGESELLRGLLGDEDAEVRGVAESALKAVAPAAGLRPGIRAKYFNDPQQTAPVAEKVLAAAAIGLRGNERFPAKLKGFWQQEDVVPANAAGQFLVSFRGKLNIPEEGQYRFYIKTDSTNRATMRLGAAGAIISPRNDRQLLYSIQSDPKGEVLTRVDFSVPVELKKGVVDVEIDYKGVEAKGQYGTPGLRLYWSSERRVMEPVPAGAYFCE
jgi:hypothetical protein